MGNGRISAKQSEILEYIKEQILEKGYPPAVREICTAVNLKSTSSVHSHLETLEKNGYIRRDPTKPRAIEIMDDEFNLSRREIRNIPLLGHVAACYLGAPYEVHVLDMAGGGIIEHYKAGHPLPGGLEKARNIAMRGGYAFIEVYVDCCRAIKDDGSVAVISC